MKTQIRLLVAAAITLGMGSCTTGSLITSSYQDDIYFRPGDVPPPVTVADVQSPTAATQDNQEEKMVISQMNENKDGTKTLNNYILKSDQRQDNDAIVYDMGQQNPAESDTTAYYNDDQVKYVINNYYDGEDLDYAFRIRRFHDPYFYDPYYWDSWVSWDNWYSPYFSFGWGYNSWNSPFSFGYYSPWGYGNRWYSPYYSYYDPWYYGGYYGYWGGNYGYWGGYYNNYYGGWSGNYADNYSYGRRRGGNTNIQFDRTQDRRLGTNLNRQRDIASKSGNSSDQGTSRVADRSSLRENSISGATRNGNLGSGNNSRANTSNQVLVEKRRDGSSISDNQRQATQLQRTATRTQSGTNQQNTSTYQRSNYTQGNQDTRTTNNNTKSGNSNTSANRASYNRQIYTRPSTSINYSSPRVVNNNNSGNTGYSTPQSNTNYNRSYRSSSTYNSSSSGNTSRSYSTPSSSPGSYRSSSPSSSPSIENSRSYNSGSSYSSGGSSGGNISSGGSSGASQSSGGSSSHSGRR
jgi:hypothetical protein